MLKDFVLETSTAPGTGTTVSLAGAPSGRRTFAQAFSSGVNAFYYLDDGTQAEWGFGVFTAGSPNTITRGTVLGNTASTTARLNFTGTTRVYNSVPAGRAVWLDTNGKLTISGFNVDSSGNVTGVAGTFTGALSALSLALTNGITGASSTLSGALNAASASITNGITAASATLTGALNAASAAITNGITAASITLTGAVNAASASITNGITAASATITTINSSGTSTLATLNAQATTVQTLGVAANIQVGTGGSGGGYYCKNGSTGGFGADVFNLYWNGTGMVLWVDTTNLGFITTSSDARYKHAVAPLAADATKQVMALRPITYRWQNKGIFQDDGADRAGFLAQEVGAVIPSAMIGDPNDPNTTLSLQPIPLIATLTKAIQEINARLTALEPRP